MTLLWLKALHIFFMIAWMAGLFYLPRIFVYHAGTQDQQTRETFKVMERRLWFFVTPFAVLTLVFGVWMMVEYGYAWFAASKWMHTKILLLVAIYAYHFYLYKLMRDFAADRNFRSPRFYRILNEAPVLVLLAIVMLAVIKPY